jgi:hypothetical protein
LLRRARDRTRSDRVERRAKLRPGAASRRLLAWRYGVAISERGPVLLPRHRPVHEPAVRHLGVGALPLQPRPPLVNDVRSRQTPRDWIRRTTRRRALPDPSATATTRRPTRPHRLAQRMLTAWLSVMSLSRSEWHRSPLRTYASLITPTTAPRRTEAVRTCTLVNLLDPADVLQQFYPFPSSFEFADHHRGILPHIGGG